MNPKKPKSRKSKSAGISLEPDLIKRGKDFAEKNGMQKFVEFCSIFTDPRTQQSAGRLR